MIMTHYLFQSVCIRLEQHDVCLFLLSACLTMSIITPDRRQSKTILSTNVDQSSLETVFFY